MSHAQQPTDPASAKSGVVLLITAAIALLWANAASSTYEPFWLADVGGASIRFWVNDGLMALFFFVVGLEIRGAMFDGELATPRQAALPIAAAIGGMVAPAAIFIALNFGREGAAGWAIPMATDIAFAVGMLAMFGSRARPAWRMLLLALAVIDDIGAIVVIAIFYSDGISLGGTLLAVASLAALLLVRRSGTTRGLAFALPGIGLWLGFLLAGIHPALAGVIVGLAIPVDRGRTLVHALHPWVTYAIMPVFALANAGVTLGGARLSGDGPWLVAGIVLGLAVGKPLGVVLVSRLAMKARIATTSPEITGNGLVLTGLVSGLGFTMSLFIATLAFPSGPWLETAKLAILAGSAAAIVLASLFALVVVPTGTTREAAS